MIRAYFDWGISIGALLGALLRVVIGALRGEGEC